jgi:polyhydroxyalkanoate synthase
MPQTAPRLAPTARSTIHREGTACLYSFSPSGSPGRAGLPLLLVPSLINRWYVLDLRKGASLVEALVGDGHDVYCLDWGAPEDEDRYLSWEDVLGRLRRAVARVRRHTGHTRVGLLGYCMGGTLAAIHTALFSDHIAALVNLAGPIDFSKGGALTEFVSPDWFDPDAVSDAGNVGPSQMQSGFTALRPTLDIAKLVGSIDRVGDKAAQESVAALDAWSSDNIAFPGEAYRTYIRELYQQNRLVEGGHTVGGREVKLSNIRCPVMTITASRDTICPPDAALALGTHSSSKVVDSLIVPGGHVGAVVGRRASSELYPALSGWLSSHLAT